MPITLPGGLNITLLSPDDEALSRLIPDWEASLKEANMRNVDPDAEVDPFADDFEPFMATPDVRTLARLGYSRDSAAANGSSIAFVAEYRGCRIMMCADAHAEVISKYLAPLAVAEGGRYRVDLMKLPHHGSARNLSSTLLAMIDCANFAISTDGSRSHEHPNSATIARILAGDPDRQKQLLFNYRQPQTLIWENTLLQVQWRYTPLYPLADENGTLTIEV